MFISYCAHQTQSAERASRDHVIASLRLKPLVFTFELSAVSFISTTTTARYMHSD